MLTASGPVETERFSLLSNSLILPKRTHAILWDMDGVLIDSLGFDFKICNELAIQYFGFHVKIPDDFIQTIFAFHPPEFWKKILAFLQDHFNVHCDESLYLEILQSYEEKRQKSVFKLNTGILDILTMAQSNQIKMAVVSNNPTSDVEELLNRSGIVDFFDVIIGNDVESCSKKPAPDTYLLATKKLNISPANCVVVEDSLLGAEAGFMAGCYTVAVATGGTGFTHLTESKYSNQSYTAFTPIQFDMGFGDVRNKRILTPNDFVSHMIEHIAWRLGMEINLQWNNDHWHELGQMIGHRLATLPRQKDVAVALGMIDDGSVEVAIDMNASIPGITFEKTQGVDLDWFFSLRCEQIQSGRPLLDMMRGLAESLQASFCITICSAEDPHHTWEGIFRSIGIALNQLKFMDVPQNADETPDSRSFPKTREYSEHHAEGQLKIVENSLEYCKIVRKTAESDLSLAVDFSRRTVNTFRFDVADSIHVDKLSYLLERLAHEADFSLQVKFHALALSSSHVVLEDTGLVLGKALLAILVLRMNAWGANCSGSSIQTREELEQEPIRLGISVEGRKFCLFVPLHESYATLRQKFLVAQPVLGDLRSEDLDDFIDGLASGLSCGIAVHFKKIPPPEQGWIQLFEHLGKALREVFAINPNRKGVPAGVKATLL